MESQFVGIDLDLILADVTTNRRDFADTFDRLQFVLHNEVLQAAKFGEAHAVFGWLQRVIVDLSQSGCIRTELRNDTIGQLRCGTAELLRDSTSRPVEVNRILKRHLDKAVAEHAFPANGFRAGNSQQRNTQRISDLVFNVFR